MEVELRSKMFHWPNIPNRYANQTNYLLIKKPYRGKPSSKKPFLHSGRLSKLSSTIRNTNSSLTNLPASISVLISFPEVKNFVKIICHFDELSSSLTWLDGLQLDSEGYLICRN